MYNFVAETDSAVLSTDRLMLTVLTVGTAQYVVNPAHLKMYVDAQMNVVCSAVLVATTCKRKITYKQYSQFF